MTQQVRDDNKSELVFVYNPPMRTRIIPRPGTNGGQIQVIEDPEGQISGFFSSCLGCPIYNGRVPNVDCDGFLNDSANYQLGKNESITTLQSKGSCHPEKITTPT